MLDRRVAIALVAVAATVGGSRPVWGGTERTGTVAGAVTVLRDGKPKPDASGIVVYVVGFDEKPPRQTARIRQRLQRFIPELLPVTAGQSVTFPNADPFFHNVFSLSPARKFDLGQYKEGETKTKSFPKPGVVEIYCNIHPDMAATILVLPNRRFARTSADGGFEIRGVPVGTWTVYAYSRYAEKPVRSQVTVEAGKESAVELVVTETRTGFAHRNKFGEPYRDPAKYRNE